MQSILIFIWLTAAFVSPAIAHPTSTSAASFSAGVVHPFSGLDHFTAMVAVGLWAALKGGRALWVWPTTFIAVMLFGGVLGMTKIAVPFVEPGIFVSVLVLGLAVALGINLPVPIGAAIIGIFALLHGHAHGTGVADTINGLEYMVGFALTTAALHALGIGLAVTAELDKVSSVIRLTGAACIFVGFGLLSGMI